MFNSLFSFWNEVAGTFEEVIEVLTSVGLGLITNNEEYSSSKALPPRINFKDEKCFIEAYFVGESYFIKGVIYKISFVFF